MALLSTIKVGSREHAIHVVTGEVLDARKWTTTTISGGGGGGTVYSANGNVQGHSNSAPIQSTTHSHAELFIRGTDGKEHVLELTNEAVRVRAGNWVSLFSAISKGEPEGRYVAITNHDTRTFSLIKRSVDAVADSGWLGLWYFAMFIGFLLASAAWIWNMRGGAPPLIDEPLFLPGILLMLPCPISWIRQLRRKSKFAAALVATCGGYEGDKRPETTAVSAA